MPQRNIDVAEHLIYFELKDSVLFSQQSWISHISFKKYRLHTLWLCRSCFNLVDLQYIHQFFPKFYINKVIFYFGRFHVCFFMINGVKRICSTFSASRKPSSDLIHLVMRVILQTLVAWNYCVCCRYKMHNSEKNNPSFILSMELSCVRVCPGNVLV